MLDSILKKLTKKKRAPRHFGEDLCFIRIENNLYPVDNWSYTGIKFQCDPAKFKIGQFVDIQMKIELEGQVESLDIKSCAIRYITDKAVALEFPSHDEETIQKLQKYSRKFEKEEMGKNGDTLT